MAGIKNLWHVLLFGGIICLLFSPPLFKLMELKYQCRQIEQQISALRQSNTVLLKEKEKLLSDPQYVEEVAREKMNMAREGEIVYKVINTNE